MVSAAENAVTTKTITQDRVSVARLINQEIAATILGVSPKWLERDRWAERRIPYVKIGRLVRYRASDIAAYIDANTQGAA
ncbi:DNA-binding protein [Paracoccus liaowanqingii]|uniref:DNA-binding protein n=2 Tax=Paracoccus liaowanqingii TaxID=2560053 RepID=A0A4Z1C0G5_9RHOB|nr:DNA-binding protein [Paracoccus liaowanqingii]